MSLQKKYLNSKYKVYISHINQDSFELKKEHRYEQSYLKIEKKLIFDYILFHPRKNTKCGIGKCIQRYRHHWLLVWDESLQHYPPVTFLPVEIPSHCECVNIGTRR